jgi:hypothetical protein
LLDDGKLDKIDERFEYLIESFCSFTAKQITTMLMVNKTNQVSAPGWRPFQAGRAGP